MFQSALRPRGRSDSPKCDKPRAPGGFNPRSAHAGGATPSQARLAQVGAVSIRAPPTRAERPFFPHLTPQSGEFQSALRPRGRSDVLAELLPDPATESFNPRSAHAGGATFSISDPQAGA